MNYPAITVIVPCCNSEKTIQDCLVSLTGLDYPKESFEIIIVDNNSSDNSVSIIKNFPVKLRYEKDIQSSYASRNKGIKEARGDILAFTDSDCNVDNYWLLNALPYFSNENIGGIAGKIQSHTSSTLEEEYQTKADIISQEHTFHHPYLPYALTANAIYRKSVFDAIGNFEREWISGGDADLSWRMQQQTGLKLAYAPDCIVHHHHRTSASGILKQIERHTYGALALNHKYQGNFQKITEPQNFFILSMKILKNALLKQYYYIIYKMTHKKNTYFLYLSKIQRIGFLKTLKAFFESKQ